MQRHSQRCNCKQYNSRSRTSCSSGDKVGKKPALRHNCKNMAPEAELPVVAVVVIGIGEKPATLAKSTSVTRGPMKPSDHHMRTNTELALTGQVYALHFYLTRWGVGW